jgi:hypothetical protein
MERAGLRRLRREQRHDDAAARVRVSDTVQDAVAGVQSFAFDIHLRDQPSLPRHMHGKMNVGRPTGIWHGSNGAKAISPLLVDLRAAVPLEGVIDASLSGRARMTVDAIGIALPDLDDASGLWPAAQIEHTPDTWITCPSARAAWPVTRTRSLSMSGGNSTG